MSQEYVCLVFVLLCMSVCLYVCVMCVCVNLGSMRAVCQQGVVQTAATCVVSVYTPPVLVHSPAMSVSGSIDPVCSLLSVQLIYTQLANCVFTLKLVSCCMYYVCITCVLQVQRKLFVNTCVSSIHLHQLQLDIIICFVRIVTCVFCSSNYLCCSFVCVSVQQHIMNKR